MPNREQLYQALRNADAAGDVEGAKKLASYIQTLGADSAQDRAPESEGKAQGKRIMADIDQANHEQGKAVTGVGETLLNLATGLGSSVVGGYRGLAQLAMGNSLEDAANSVTQTQQDYTYQPKTGIGKLVSELATVPFNAAKAMASSIGGDIGQAVNGQQGRIAGESIGNVLPDVVGTLAGGRAALSGVQARAAAGLQRRAPVAPAVDYDVPAFVRNGVKPVVPEIAVPEPSPVGAAMRSPLEEYAAAPQEAPYVALNEPVPLPAASGAQSALDQYAANPETAAPAVPPMAASLRVPESAPAVELPPQVAADASIGQAVLDQYGIKLPEGAATSTDAALPSSSAPGVAFDLSGPLDPSLRQQVLSNVGITRMRKSALEGNEAAAASDYQLSKFTNEPAGMAALDQFAHERDALAAHVQGMIDRTGAVSGLDESALQAKGRDIAAPYDAAREYFEKAKQSLYDIADQRAAASKVPVATGPLDSLLGDPDFRATLMAKDQQGLLSTIESQYQRFKELGPDGKLTMTNAERFRKWLNTVWSPDKSQTIGQVKAALDEGVFKSAGTDVYQTARSLHMQEKRIFDDPKGIAKLFDADPYTPINRATPYNKIPDAIINLSPDQFAHIVNTYKDLPEALQPAAQKAMATLRAHYADKLLDAGTSTSYGNARQLWNRGGVNQIVRNNSAKLPLVFDAQDLAKIRDLVDAGNIQAVNASYPGASAQAAQALKRGLMSRFAGRATAALGGGAGAMFGPAGAGAGALLGDAVGGKIIDHIGERRALNEFKKNIIDTSLQQPAPAMRVPDISRLGTQPPATPVPRTPLQGAIDKLNDTSDIDRTLAEFGVK